MKLLYVVKRFPKFSETFVLREIEEVVQQGDDVVVYSLTRPHPREPRHHGTEEVVRRTMYLPVRAARLAALVWAAAVALATRPARAWPALAWSAGWCIRERRADHLKRFGEACWIVSRAPHDVDHVHAHFAHGPTTVALLLGMLADRPFSFTAHARDIFELVTPELLRAKIARTKFVATVSAYTRDYVAEHAAPDDRAKVVVVRNGIDRRKFAPAGTEPNGRPLLLSVSRLVEKKGLDTLVDACARLAARGVHFRCEVIGDGPERTELEQRAGNLGLGDRFELVGSAAHDHVATAYREAALFVLPCRRTASGDRDGLPVALIEAMSAGVPPVTTPVSGIPEVVHQGESGVLVREDDATALADAIEQALHDRALRGRLAAGARRATEQFDLEACVRRLRNLFRAGPAAA